MRLDTSVRFDSPRLRVTMIQTGNYYTAQQHKNISLPMRTKPLLKSMAHHAASQPYACRMITVVRAFTLIELLVVISIIALLISILLPSLSRARDQAKSVHCLAKLKELGNALATYENTSQGILPPARWFPSTDDLDFSKPNPLPRSSGETRFTTEIIEYGWTELLFQYVYGEQVNVPVSYPVQRNVEGRRWEEYFLCKAVGYDDVNSGHYRVYLPAWSGDRFYLREGRVYDDTVRLNPMRGGRRENVSPKLPLIGDANENSERGDGFGLDECSYIDAGEANYVGSDGRSNGNRFSDRHYGGANYLFQDLHGSWKPRLRKDLARDYDLNGVIDIEEER